jgi:hypothetical protein
VVEVVVLAVGGNGTPAPSFFQDMVEWWSWCNNFQFRNTNSILQVVVVVELL